MNTHTTPRDHRVNIRDFPTILSLQTLSNTATVGKLTLNQQSWPCVLGKTGCTTHKREGDHATPTGLWKILRLLYRPDRIARPLTALPIKTISRHDGWCDAPTDRNYNRPVTRPYPASCESLWRNDHAYDLCLILDYNISHRKKGSGSAIFFHLTKPERTPTEGCLAVDKKHMLQILGRLKKESYVQV